MNPTPQPLQSLHPRHLMRLLSPYQAYFEARGVDLSRLAEEGPDYEAICRAVMAPGEDTPTGLIDELHLVHEMASPDAMDALLEVARGAGVQLDVGEESTPADVAAQLGLVAPRLLEEKHAEFFLSTRRRTFEYFKSRAGVDARLRAPGAARLKCFEEALGAGLESMGRGRGCTIRSFVREDGAWFLVRQSSCGPSSQLPRFAGLQGCGGPTGFVVKGAVDVDPRRAGSPGGAQRQRAGRRM